MPYLLEICSLRYVRMTICKAYVRVSHTNFMVCLLDCFIINKHSDLCSIRWEIEISVAADPDESLWILQKSSSRTTRVVCQTLIYRFFYWPLSALPSFAQFVKPDWCKTILITWRTICSRSWKSAVIKKNALGFFLTNDNLSSKYTENTEQFLRPTFGQTFKSRPNAIFSANYILTRSHFWNLVKKSVKWQPLCNPFLSSSHCKVIYLSVII